MMIRTIEELSINAWPAAQTMLYDGWILRFGGGYTRRANSVSPLYASSLPLDQKIAACEQLYGSRSLKTIFKLIPAAEPADLDERLAEDGYQKEALTSVQTLDLKEVTLLPAQAAVNRSEVEEGGERCRIWRSGARGGVALTPALTKAWFSSYCQSASIGPADRDSLWSILRQIIPEHCFAILHSGEHPVAYGVGVVQDGYLGLFDILTEKAYRKQGYGQQIITSLLAWGQQKGATRAYLQVMLDNPPALRLYARLGFQECYRYWYRVKVSNGKICSLALGP